jgi:hypothetical protein
MSPPSIPKQAAILYSAATLAATLLSASLAHANDMGGSVPSMAAPQIAGLRAHDINGYALDMTVSQVAAQAGTRLEPLGGGQFKVSSGAIEYDFGFTPLGRLYRIDSSQRLGEFAPDRSFGLVLARRLATKYGEPHQNALPGGPALWGYAESYVSADGMLLRRGTESLSAMMSGGFGMPITLDLKLMDFRILRRDEAAMNARPKSNAERAMTF